MTLSDAEEHRLRELGIPEDVVRRVSDREYPKIFLFWYAVLPLATLFAFLGLAMVYTLGVAEVIQENLRHQRLAGSAFYAYQDIGPGVHGVLAVFVAIFLSPWPAYSITLRYPRFSEYVALRSTFESFSFPFGQNVVQGVMDRVEVTNPDHYFDEMNKGYRRASVKGALLLALISAGFASFDYNSFSFITNENIEYSNYFSFDKDSKSLSEVTSIGVGCRVVDGDASLYYVVSAGDEFSINLFEAYTSGIQIADIEQFDALLVSTSMPKVRHWMEGNPLFKARYAYDSDCPAAIREQFGEDADRVTVLVTPEIEPG